MSSAEQIYRVLLRLYPAKHRKVYGPSMLQHARDLNRTAQQRGSWHVVALWLRLLIDGIVNAVIEHREAIMTTNGKYKPVPWLSVLLAAIPGLWVALSKRQGDELAPLLQILGGGYILLFAIGLPAMWWRRRQFPVWGLMFAGLLTWFLTYTAGHAILIQLNLPYVFGWGMGTVILNIALATALFVVLLRGQHVPGSVWALIGLIVLFQILGGNIYGSIILGNNIHIRKLLQFLLASLVLPAEGLMLVGVGLLVARQHGVLALLFVVGGYSYMFLDSDYLFGSRVRDWSGLSLYLVTVSLLVLVLMPVALLRAKTRLGRALAVFGPLLVFVVVRLALPIVATGRSFAALLPGDVGISLNVLLALIVGWFLYSHIGDVSHNAEYKDDMPTRVISPTVSG